MSVVEAKDAAQALERLGTESIDLALMDINMPDMDGYTLTAKIKAMPEYSESADCRCHSQCDAWRPGTLAGGRLRWLYPKTD